MPKSKGSLRTGVAVFAFAIGAICAAPPALAQHGITLPAASLEDSLNLLSRQSGVQILVDQNLVRGKKARPIKSVSSVEAALAQLLHGTDLTYQKRGDASDHSRRRCPARQEDGRRSAAQGREPWARPGPRRR